MNGGEGRLLVSLFLTESTLILEDLKLFVMRVASSSVLTSRALRSPTIL
jgi:hypothetical protein